MLKSGGNSFQASNKSAFPVKFQNVVNDSIFKHKYIRLGNKPKVKTDEYCRTMDLSKKKHSFLPDRPANSGSLERRCQGKYLLRPALQIKRFSSPPGTLQGFDQYMKEQTNERAASPDIVRRSGLSRKHYYGSLEALNSIHSSGSDQSENAGSRFRMESGEIGTYQNGLGSRQGSGVHLENPEFQTRWYFKYFLGKVHQNFVGIDGSKNHFILSVCLTDADNYGAPQYRAILWRKTGCQKLCIPYQPNKPVSPKSVLGYVITNYPASRWTLSDPKEVLNPEIQKELLVLEEQEGSVNFKFGVLYAKEGQSTDDEVFSNVTSSDEFENFLELLGQKIELKGWKKYRGGLDVRNDMTGSHSLYTVYEGHEVMFHVSTLLPFTPDNPQQVSLEYSHFVKPLFSLCHRQNICSGLSVRRALTEPDIYALVSFNKMDGSYRLTFFSDKNVPIFGPPLPCPPIFSNHQEFRDFLLVKLMNGEKAAYASPTFSNRRQRTLDSLITRLLQDHMHVKLCARKSWNDALDSSKGNRLKGIEREQAFLQLGQSLKLQTIVKGGAPTSLASTSGNSRFEPWEPQCVYEDFPSKILCGDSWGNGLVLGTEDGIQVIQGKKYRHIFDKSVVAKQISVVETFGLFLFRVDKGKQ
ncbi:PREDICTED: GTPase-activating Rap/Ran-GAP domain-like protein 3 [Acropora digitifera]|uniref:GTPase-activating Rap/Ran-GAP domain-like protein 3 n=1 Tax=Acropora digitifera TaxID=70779 RepID=UPI00077A28DD|nr:PREDICTED: GTPase-activating Rap/Ran-GAP domain-like protein 3 [Acropora digitifera]